MGLEGTMDVEHADEDLCRLESDLRFTGGFSAEIIRAYRKNYGLSTSNGRTGFLRDEEFALREVARSTGAPAISPSQTSSGA